MSNDIIKPGELFTIKFADVYLRAYKQAELEEKIMADDEDYLHIYHLEQEINRLQQENTGLREQNKLMSDLLKEKGVGNVRAEYV